jgi:hypothetical protein
MTLDYRAVWVKNSLRQGTFTSFLKASVCTTYCSNFRDMIRVQQLGKYTSLKLYDVPPSKFKSFEHDGRQIVAAYWADSKGDISKIRFDDKVDAAVELGMITESLGGDIKDIYEARNSIHIHAELKKNLEFDLDIGKLAYRRMQPFCDQVQRYVASQAS